MKIFILILLLGIFPMTSPGHASEHDSGWYPQKIQELKDPARTSSDKWKISREIQAAGKSAIPFLIGCVKDSTSIGTTPLMGGECINRPGHLPIPPQCENPVRSETLGERCESILYNILTPAYTSPYRVRTPGKDIPLSPFVIKDWNQWWEKYQKESLEKIHQEARKKIDEFWQLGHRNSVVWQ